MKTPETQQMEQLLQEIIKRSKDISPKRINQMMPYELVECSHEDQTLTFAFSIEPWMLNPMDILHGGIICTAMDITLGALSIYVNERHTSATATMSVNFIRPILEGDVMHVTAKCYHVGRTMAQIQGEARSAKTGMICATSSAIFSMATNYKARL